MTVPTPIKLRHVKVTLCQPCIDGAGKECPYLEDMQEWVKIVEVIHPAWHATPFVYCPISPCPAFRKLIGPFESAK